MDLAIENKISVKNVLTFILPLSFFNIGLKAKVSTHPAPPYNSPSNDAILCRQLKQYQKLFFFHE